MLQFDSIKNDTAMKCAKNRWLQWYCTFYTSIYCRTNKQPTGSSLIKYCTDEEGCDLPDVQLIFNVSPIWYWLCSPLMCGPSLGKSIPLCMVFGIKRMGEKATCTEVE